MILLNPYAGAKITREGKLLIVGLTDEHQVLSTCEHNGGLRTDIQAIYNRQMCEPAAHAKCHETDHVGRAAQHEHICQSRGWEPERVVTLATAASMDCLGISTMHHNGLSVTALATAGVAGNSARAGQGARWWEHGQAFYRITTHPKPGITPKTGEQPHSRHDTDQHDQQMENSVKQPTQNPTGHGTINIIVLINKPLLPGAMVRAVTMATEAKTAALQDLRVGALDHPRRATGTGTDQICVAALAEGNYPMITAGHHTVLGEMIGKTVTRAVRQALTSQQGLDVAEAATLTHQWARFGLTAEGIVARSADVLDAESHAILTANLGGLLRNPRIVAAAAGLAEIVDQVRDGILPDSILSDALGTAGAILAGTVAGKHSQFEQHRLNLASVVEPILVSEKQPHGECPVVAAARTCVEWAIVVGFGERWKHGQLVASSLS